jgi:hypothetical protein
VTGGLMRWGIFPCCRDPVLDKIRGWTRTTPKVELPMSKVSRRANAAPEKPARKSPETGIFLLLFGLAILAYEAQFAYGYWVGTPTTATVTHCQAGGLLPKWPGSSTIYCDGT